MTKHEAMKYYVQEKVEELAKGLIHNKKEDNDGF